MADLSLTLTNAPRNCWLALSADEDRVVGEGKSIEEAVKAAEESGESDPVLMWSPKEWVPAVFMSNLR